MPVNTAGRARAICLAAMVLLLSIIIAPVSKAYGADVEIVNQQQLNIQARLNHEVLRQGQKGIDGGQVSFIDIMFDPEFNIASPADLQKIKVLAGNQDEAAKFTMDGANGFIRLQLKAGQTLTKHVLYDIYIPAGVIKKVSSSQILTNPDLHFYLVTSASDGLYHKDILQSVTPADRVKSIDNSPGQVVFEFIDDIAIDQQVLNNIGNYIEISSQRIDRNVPGYNIAPSYQRDDSIANYNVQVDGSKLIITAKAGQFKDFANYTVKLKNSTVYLQKPYQQTGLKIYNQEENHEDYQTIQFSTGNMLTAADPANNAEGVSVEPTIRLYFKYPVEINDDIDPRDLDSYIKLSSDVQAVPIDVDREVSISADGKTLQITLDDHQDNRNSPLHRQTLYQLDIKPDFIRFVDYPIFNPEIKLHFITRGEGQSPLPVSYSSDPAGSDDIRYLEHSDPKDPAADKISNLDKDGSIFIHFDRSIRADNQLPIDYLSLTQGVKLYQMPASEGEKYDAVNNRKEEITAYNSYQDPTDADIRKIIPAAIPTADVAGDYSIIEDNSYMEEVPVDKAEILDGGILKITPLYPLESLNKYQLTVDSRVIEDENGYNLETDLSVGFWVKANPIMAAPVWESPAEATAQKIEEKTSAPYKSYTLYGVPRYGPDDPLVLNVAGTVIPYAGDEIIAATGLQLRRISYDALKNITLTDVYNTNAATRQVNLEKYEFHYYTAAGKNYTSLYLYPAKKLAAGTNYRLEVPEKALIGRSGTSPGKLEVNFVVKGDTGAAAGVCQLENNVARVTDIFKNGWTFKIRGYNFTDNVSQVILTPQTGRVMQEGDKVIIAAADTELASVTELLVKIRGDNAAKLSQESYTGQYQVRVVFINGTSINVGTGDFTEMDLELKGQNFRSDIKQVTLKQVEGTTSIVLGADEVEFVDSQTLNLKIRGDNARTLASAGNTGEYNVTIDYETSVPFSSDLSRWDLELYGQNLGSGIQKIILRPTSGNAVALPASERDMVIAAAAIREISSSHIYVRVEGENLSKLQESAHAGSYNVIIQAQNQADLVSDVKIVVTSYGIKVAQTVVLASDDTLSIDNELYIPGKSYFTVLSKGRPIVKGYYPEAAAASQWYDENTLFHDIQDEVTANQHFLKVIFEDIDGKLEFNDLGKLTNTTVTVPGSSNSWLNQSFLTAADLDPYIFRKDRDKQEAYLYIPVKLLQAQMTYTVNIPGEVVKNDSSEKYNSSISWSFTTMAIPAVLDKDITVQSVTENYDLNQPIIIKGSLFYGPSIKVYFNDIPAAKVEGPYNDSNGQKYLTVYLPDPRLDPGLYNIIIENDSNHQRITYGTLSVVAAGNNVPQDGQRVRLDDDDEDYPEGQVTETVLSSEDTLWLKGKYTDKNKVEINLDELMGEDVLVRKIKYEADRHDSIGRLTTLSRWADITLYDVQRDNNGNEIEIRLGRTSPVVTRTLQAKLVKWRAKSDFIEVGGENFKVDKVDLSIPYRQSDGMVLQALRYDPESRNWYEVPFTIDRVEQKVLIDGADLGIFVIVE